MKPIYCYNTAERKIRDKMIYIVNKNVFADWNGKLDGVEDAIDQIIELYLGKLRDENIALKKGMNKLKCKILFLKSKSSNN